MTSRRHAMIAITLLAAAGRTAAAPFELVERTEYERERRHVDAVRARFAAAQAASAPAGEEIDPDAPPLVMRAAYPAIRIVAPAATAADALKAPLRLELAFVAAPGTRIVPESFRVLYGLLKLDITERLRRHAQLSERGMVAEAAALPAGAHRLYLQVADNQGRHFERELRFRVDP